MTDLLQMLFDYAYKQRKPFPVADEAQYKESEAISKRNYDYLCRLISQEGRECLDDYIGEQHIMHSLDLESAFLAGLSLGLELSRL